MSSISKISGPQKAEGLFAAALLLAFIAVAGGHASEKFLTVAEMTEQAEVVARARVTSTTTDYFATSRGKLPFLVYKAETRSVMCGEIESSFTLLLPAAESKSGIKSLPDNPAFKKGADYVFFLKRAEDIDDEVFYLFSPLQAALPIVSVKDGEEAVPLPLSNQGSRRGTVFVRPEHFAAHVKAVRQNAELERKK